MLEGKWKNYTGSENDRISDAYVAGFRGTKYVYRHHTYEYNFETMMQVNSKTKKERMIRPPPNLNRPDHPLLPKGPMIVVAVKEDGQTEMTLDDPSNPGQTIEVYLPPGVRKGDRVGIPVPLKGEDLFTAIKRQQDHQEKFRDSHTRIGMVGNGKVGGVVLTEAEQDTSPATTSPHEGSYDESMDGEGDGDGDMSHMSYGAPMMTPSVMALFDGPSPDDTLHRRESTESRDTGEDGHTVMTMY